MTQIAHGAEAILFREKIFEKELCIKQRVSKKYRQPSLDKRILKTRNREEALLLKKVKEGSLKSPVLYYVSENKIIMEYIENDNQHKKLLLKIGEEIAKLHNLDIIHGDLNLINILTSKGEIYFIDFGLGFVSLKEEDKATDLLGFKKTLLSLKKTSSFWERILEGYLSKTRNRGVVEKIKDIEKRARYL